MWDRYLAPSILGVVFLAVLAGCAGPREIAETREPVVDPAPVIRMADFEDFDPSVYREQPPRRATPVTHDVPDRLMEGRADAGVRMAIQGYRVQIYSTLDRNTAAQIEESALEWWRSNGETAPPGLFSGGLDVDVVYAQPYYRVRIGNFTSRDTAERALRFLARRFPDAFIARDTVIVTR